MSEKIFGTPQTNVSFGKLGKSQKSNDYKKLKNDYKKQKAKQDKSDLANSPIVINGQLQQLHELRKAAQAEGLKKEIEWVDKQIEQLFEKMIQLHYENIEYLDGNETIEFEVPKQEISVLMDSMPVYPAIIQSQVQPAVNDTDADYEKSLNELLSNYIDENGRLNPQIEKLIGILPKVDEKIDLYLLKNLISHCQNESGEIDNSNLYVVEMLAANGIKPANIPYYFEQFYSPQSGKTDFESIKGCIRIHSQGVDDITSVAFQNYLNSQNFEDDNAVINSMVKLYNADAKLNPEQKMSASTVVEIINMLRTKSETNGKLKVDEKTVGLTAHLKAKLTELRHNSQREYQSPLNNLGITVVGDNDNIILMKDGEILYSSDKNENYEYLKKQYEEISQKSEEKLLLDFIEKYKNSDGKVETKYFRLANLLKDYGIVNEKLLDLIDYCIDSEGNPDNDKLVAVKTLKHAGALSADIPELADACTDKNPESPEMKAVCRLTEGVIPADTVRYFLPVVKDSEDAIIFVQNTLPYFKNREDIMNMIKMCQGKDGKTDENAISIINNLLFSANTDLADEDFVKMADEVLTIARISDYEVSDLAAGICAVMSSNESTPDEIKQGLLICLDNRGVLDEGLSDLLWNLSVSDLKFDNSEIFDIINSCKNANMEPDADKIEEVNSLLDSELDKVVIKSLILG